MKQFTYTRKEKIEKPQVNGEEQPVEYADMVDSFNLEMVIRSIARPDGTRLVILNDFHEETRPAPIFNKKREVTGMKNERNTYQSEILLNVEDSVKFLNAISAV